LITVQVHQLDESQRREIASLFCDSQFDTDPAAYRYEVDEAGHVTGRCMITKPAKRSKAHKPQQTVTLIEAQAPTEDQIHRARMHMDSLAAIVARTLYEENRS
jgi:hypothetical protein